MMKRYLIPATPLAAMMLLTGCMDNNYDLANIDTTTQVNVKGLVVPVNVNPITLDDVIDADNYTPGTSGKLVKYGPADAKIYAYIFDGTFESDNITIDAFDVQPSSIEPSIVVVKLPDAPASMPKRAGAADDVIKYDVNATPN